jgi:DNA-binding NtrC family response regulator
MPDVLVIDDDEDFRLWVTTVLTDQGYNVSTLPGPEGAISQLLRGGIDLVLLDYQMPGQDGLSVLRDMDKARISTPTIVLTSDSSQAVAVECFRNGAVDFIAKPVDPDYLSIVVERALNSFAGTLKNMSYKALGYVQHKKECAHFNDPRTCDCGLKEVIIGIQDF